MSIANGIYRALKRGKELECDTVQIFTKNATQWRAKPLTTEDIELLNQAREETGIEPLIAHTGYLINLATPDGALYERSLEALGEEIQRVEALRVPYLVMHPGSYRTGEERQGLYQVARGINLLFYRGGDPGLMILLETTAGQGSSLGHSFEHLALIIEMVEEDQRVGVCLDTCHVFAAGYDISTPKGYEATMNEFDKVIGLDRLKVIHLNDSKVQTGTRVDRHEHIGHGYIGLEPFRLLLKDPRLAAIPFILETPKEKDLNAEDWDRVNLRVLRELL